MKSGNIYILLLMIFFANCNAFGQIYLHWSNIYNDTAGNMENSGICLAVDNSGNIILSGYTGSLLASSDIITLKYSAVGSLIWKKTFNAGINHPSQAVSVVRDNSDHYFVAGYCNITSVQSKLIIIKYDSSGNLIWNRFYNYKTDSVTVSSKMLIDSAGFLYICGYTTNLNGKDLLLMKCDPTDGDTVWVRTYNNIFNRDDQGYDIIFDKDNNLIVGGSTSPGSGAFDYLILKYSAGGLFLWEKSFNFRPEDFLHTLSVDKYNNILATGSSRYYSPGPPPGHYYLESFSLTVKYDQNGNFQWSNTDGMGCSDCNVYHHALDIKSDTAGNVFIAGASNGNLKTIKYSPTGNLAWKRIYSSTLPSYFGQATNIIIDSESNIYTFGYTAVSIGNTDIFSVKYLNLIGNQSWVGSYSSPVKDDIIASVVNDNSGNIYITGYSVNLSGNKDILLLKYSFNPTGITSENNQVSGFSLYQNFPNPFNPVTNIKFTLSIKGLTVLKILDITGKEVAVLVNENLNAGEYNFQFPIDNHKLSSGVYFYQLKTGNFIQTKKMLLIK